MKKLNIANVIDASDVFSQVVLLTEIQEYSDLR